MGDTTKTGAHAFLVRFADTVRGLSDAHVVAETACRMLALGLASERAHWSEVDWSTREFVLASRFVADGVPDTMAGRYPLDGWEPVTSTLLVGRSTITDDPESDDGLPDSVRKNLTRLAIGARIAVPVMSEGTLRAVLSVNQSTPRKWTPEEIALVEGVAARCWAEVERTRAEQALRASITDREHAELTLRESEERQTFLLALSDALRPHADPSAIQQTWTSAVRTRAEEALRESEAKYRSLFETLDDGYALAELVRDAHGNAVDFRVLEANHAWTRLAGARVLPSVEAVAAAAAAGAAMRVEAFHPGLERWLEVRIVPAAERFTCLVADVTARREAERARHAVEERLAFLLKLTDTLRTLSDSVEIQRAAMKVVGEHLQVDRVLYAEFDRDGREYTILDDYVAPGVGPRVGRFPTGVYPTMLQSFARGETAVIPDMQRTTLMSDPEKAAAVADGLLAAVGVPLLEAGRLVAQLSVQQLRPRAWTAAEVAILQETAERTWAAIERARAEDALRQSEEHLRMAMEAARFFSWEFDLTARQARFVSGSADDARAFLPEGDLRDGMARIRDHVLPEDSERLSDAVRRTMEGEGDLHAEFRARHPGTGETIWFESHATLVKGPRARVSGITRNVTEHKRADEERRKSAERHAFSLDLSDALRPLREPLEIKAEATRRLREQLGVGWCAYAKVDPSATVATVVSEATRPGLPSLLGEHELSRRPDLAQPLGAGSVLAIADLAMFPALERAAAERYAALGLRAVLAIPILEDGRAVALVLVADTSPRAWTASDVELVRDVAERTGIAVGRVRAEASLRASETRLQLADRAKDEFLATLGHELRTPLAAILLWGGALRSGKLPASEHGHAVDAIVECATVQSLLIDDLLDLSRLVAGKLRLSRESVTVADAARGIAEIVRPMAQAKKLSLVVEAADDLGRAVLDPMRLRQVLWNLLSNAIKFTPEGGTVSLRMQRRDGHLETVVTDTGEGIEPSFIPHVFERFQQADMGESRLHGGLGIGLALSRELVELQGGSIEAESPGRGRGATFRVRLPWVEGRATSELASVARSSTTNLAPTLQGVSVVLVEDEPHTLAAMESTLARAGAAVIAVRSGQAALDALAAADDGASPVVLVSDLGLPGMTGYELVERAASMRKANGRAAIPACAVSSHARDTDRQRAIEAGFDIYVAKPVTADELVEAVGDLVPIAEG